MRMKGASQSENPFGFPEFLNDMRVVPWGVEAQV